MTTLQPAAIRASLERVRDGKTVVPAKLAMRLRGCIAEVARARADAESAHQRRLASLETQRIPHPEAFRERQMQRSEPAIGKGAADILATARAHLDAGFDALKKEWTEAMARETRKKGIDARIRDINERGKVQVLELLESTSELIAREMQDVGETLEHWALDEIQTSYHTAKRRRIESLAPLASEVTSEDLAAPLATRVPIAGPRETFQRQRWVVAFVGCAVAAGAGTLVHPGIGTLVGALVGWLPMWLKSPASLRTGCIACIDAYTTTARAGVNRVLDTKNDELAMGIREALDGALAETLARLNESITRLMTVERDAIDSERTMLAQLLSTRGTLETHEERLREGLNKVSQP